MIVEFQLASLAVFVWWFSEPGIIHAIALNTMVVCTVGTLFFNGNPLLRYDGYFILVDLLGIPNLWQESRLALKSALAKWFLRPEFVAARQIRRNAAERSSRTPRSRSSIGFSSCWRFCCSCSEC